MTLKEAELIMQASSKVITNSNTLMELASFLAKATVEVK